VVKRRRRKKYTPLQRLKNIYIKMSSSELYLISVLTKMDLSVLLKNTASQKSVLEKVSSWLITKIDYTVETAILLWLRKMSQKLKENNNDILNRYFIYWSYNFSLFILKFIMVNLKTLDDLKKDGKPKGDANNR
jgi:hypothetical protein